MVKSLNQYAAIIFAAASIAVRWLGLISNTPIIHQYLVNIAGKSLNQHAVTTVIAGRTAIIDKNWKGSMSTIQQHTVNSVEKSLNHSGKITSSVLDSVVMSYGDFTHKITHVNHQSQKEKNNTILNLPLQDGTQ